MSVSLRRTSNSEQDKKSRFEEVDQDTFHQDLQSPEFCSRNDCCSLCAMILSIFVITSVFLWLMYGLTYNGLKALNFANQTLVDISLLNLTNNSLFSNKLFY